MILELGKPEQAKDLPLLAVCATTKDPDTLWVVVGHGEHVSVIDARTREPASLDKQQTVIRYAAQLHVQCPSR